MAILAKPQHCAKLQYWILVKGNAATLTHYDDLRRYAHRNCEAIETPRTRRECLAITRAPFFALTLAGDHWREDGFGAIAPSGTDVAHDAAELFIAQMREARHGSARAAIEH